MMKADRHKKNARLTVNEMRTHLRGTAFEAFCDWLTGPDKEVSRRWASFDRSCEGSLSGPEISMAVEEYLASSDGRRDPAHQVVSHMCAARFDPRASEHATVYAGSRSGAMRAVWAANNGDEGDEEAFPEELAGLVEGLHEGDGNEEALEYKRNAERLQKRLSEVELQIREQDRQHQLREAQRRGRRGYS